MAAIAVGPARRGRRRLKILVTDGDNRATLAVTRSLGRAGHTVVVGERRARSLAQASRFCAGHVVYPDPTKASDSFVDYLASIVKADRFDMLIPVADVSTFLITGHRDRFEPHCTVPVGPAAVVERAANKVDVFQMAMALGVPVPRSVIVDHGAPLPELGFGFPVVIKPRQSRVRTPAGWVSSSVGFADDRAALLRELSARPRHEFPLLVQERIEGPGVGVFACYQAGRPVALFSHHRLRERPPWGGVSVLSESVPLDPVARDAAVKLLDALRWQGVAMVEFKRDLRDGLPKLMEINGRFWGSLQLAIDAGVDFPSLLVETSTGRTAEPQPYRLGVRSRWLWGDLDALLLVLIGRTRTMGVRRSRLRATMEFLVFWGRDLHFENPRWDDPGPWWHESRQRLFPRLRARPKPAAPLQAPRTQPDGALTVTTVQPTVRFASSLSELGVDEKTWNGLAAQSETNTVFQTHQWHHSLEHAFGPTRQLLFAAVIDQGRPLAIMSIEAEKRRSGTRILRFFGNTRADYCDVIAGPRKAEAVTRLADALFARDDWDILDFNRVPAASQTPALIQAAGIAAGFRTLVSEHSACPTLLIAGHEDEVKRLHNRPSLRRRVNYFQRSGRLALRDMSLIGDVEPYLDAFFAQHVSRWAHTGSPSLFLDPLNVAFYRSLSARLSNSGWLLFSVAELDDVPIAFHYGFDYNGVVLWYKPTFDVAHAKHSPGLLMVRHLIRYALDRGRTELDFALGDESFKRRFTNMARHTERVQVFRHPVDHSIARTRRGLASLAQMVTRRFR